MECIERRHIVQHYNHNTREGRNATQIDDLVTRCHTSKTLVSCRFSVKKEAQVYLTQPCDEARLAHFPSDISNLT